MKLRKAGMIVLSGIAVLSALSLIVSCAETQEPAGHQHAMTRVIDMSHVITPGDAGRKFSVEMVNPNVINPNVVRLENQWYIMHNIEMVSHIGTHIEVPYHLAKDGLDLAQFPIENLCGEAVVLDLRDLTPQTSITVGQIEAAAEKAGGIRDGDIVLCNLGYAGKYGTDAYAEAPYFSTESIEWLVAAGMKMMGVDATGVEIPGSEEHVNHHALLDNDIPLIENITGFDDLSRTRFLLYAFPIAVKGLESFPVRVVAIEEG
jgi:arylformamidase